LEVVVAPEHRQAPEVERADLQGCGDAGALVAARHRLPVVEDVQAQEDEAERDHGQVVAPQAEREGPDQSSDEPADHGRGGQPHVQRQVPRPADVHRGVGPTPQEEGVAQRDLPGVAGEQVEAHGPDGGDAGEVEDIHPEDVVHPRGEEDVDQRQEDEAGPGLARPEQPEVLGVVAGHVEITKVHQTRRTSLVPKRP
jgi:hypothetical protein